MGDVDDFGRPTSAPADGFAVCAECFGDADIGAFIRSNADSGKCDFCKQTSRTRSIAAPLDKVVESIIIPAILREFEFAADALGWDGAEGGYQGSHWDSEDLLADRLELGLPNDNGRLLDILAKCLGDQVWCELDPYSLRRGEQLIGSWEEFCDLVKHRRRYFFLQAERAQRYLESEYLTPAELLQFIGRAAVEHQLVRTLPEGSLVYRARRPKSREILRSPSDFGPPPSERAVQANRMSPAGIVMFYGSEELKTAVAEIDDGSAADVSVGTFQTTRVVSVLDLTQLPERLGFFEMQSDSDDRDRYAIDFLHSFVSSLRVKVKRGEREQIDYVPTQVVTEWFRTAFRHKGKAIDGIRYMSAELDGGKSLVLFADQDALSLNPEQMNEAARRLGVEEWQVRWRHKDAWLRLVRRRVVRP